jgi:hypothetical protein
MFRARIVQPIRLLGVACISAFFVIAIIGLIGRPGSSKERSRLLVSLLKEELSTLKNSPVDFHLLNSTRVWPDDFLLLESWVIQQIIHGASIEKTAQSLELLAAQHHYSRTMEVSLSRWNKALSSWAESRYMVSAHTPERLLEVGRQKHFEADGFQRIGRKYDAAILYLWSGTHLAQFVELNPESPDVPEALYLLGNCFLKLRHAFPTSLRMDRMTSLVSDLYPNSVWSRKASILWQEEMLNGT